SSVPSHGSSRVKTTSPPPQGQHGNDILDSRLGTGKNVVGQHGEVRVPGSSEGAHRFLRQGRGRIRAMASRCFGSGLSRPTPWSWIAFTTASLTGVGTPTRRPWAQTDPLR